MSLQALFDFITDPTVNESNMDEYLDMRMQQADQEKDLQQQEVEDAVFKQAYIPQRLTQVSTITALKTKVVGSTKYLVPYCQINF